MSLRLRIAGTIFVPGTLLASLVLAVALGHSLRGVREQVAAAEAVTIGLLGDLSRGALITQDYAELQSFVANTRHDPRLRAVLVADHQGLLVASTRPELVGTPLPAAMPAGPDRYWRTARVAGYSNRLGELAVEFSDAPLLAGYRATLELGLALAVAGMAALALVGLATGHVLTRRLRALALAADAVTDGEAGAGPAVGTAVATPPAPPPAALADGGDEVARVGRAFAAMVGRLRTQLDELARARDRLAAPTEAMAQGFALWDHDDRLVLHNSRLCQLLPGLGPVIAEGVGLRRLVQALEGELAAEDGEALHERWLAARDRPAAAIELRLRDGRRIEVRESRTRDGGTVGIYTDVTVERARERALARNARRLREMMAAVSDAILAVDEAGNVEAVNAAGERLFGWPARELVGRPLKLLLAREGATGEAGPPLGPADLHGLVLDGLVDLRGRRRDGSTFPAEVSTGEAESEGRTIGVLAVRDVTQRKEAEARVRHHATHDHLTGLPNRALLEDRLEAALAHAGRRRERVAVLFLDLDRFKFVNDTLGHAAGDALLVEAAARFRDAVRTADTVARLGGDEFVVLLRDLREPEDATAVAEKLAATLRRPFPTLGQEPQVGLSVGVALFPEHGGEPAALLRHADAALYEAKRAGRGRVRLYAPAMGAASRRRMLVETRLRRALARDGGGELSLVYQPQFALGTGALRGFEALARWDSPELGPVGPAEFVPVAEESGLVAELGRWVARTALRESSAWRGRGAAGRRGRPPVRLGINVSCREFRDAGLAAGLREAAAAAGTGAAGVAGVELEVTERVLMDEDGAARPLVDELAGMGVGLTLDDFGTGYAALAHLRRYPIARIKIDRSLVADLEGSGGGGSIRLVRAVIGLAHGLGASVIAEGVETPGQLSALRRRGCDEAQGYLLGRPAGAAAAARMVQGGHDLGRALADGGAGAGTAAEAARDLPLAVSS